MLGRRLRRKNPRAGQPLAHSGDVQADEPPLFRRDPRPGVAVPRAVDRIFEREEPRRVEDVGTYAAALGELLLRFLVAVARQLLGAVDAVRDVIRP